MIFLVSSKLGKFLMMSASPIVVMMSMIIIYS